AALRRELDEAQGNPTRSVLLAAFVEIAIAEGDTQAAGTAARELSEIARSLDAPLVQTASAYATGAVCLAEGEPRPALAALRQAWAGWQELEVPYEAARVRVLIGLCCRELGDDDTAEM